MPVLRDGEVVLDALTPHDAEAHWAGEDDEQARRFGWYPRRSSLEQVRDYLARVEAEWQAGGPRRAWAVRTVRAPTRTLVGGCEVRLQQDGTAQLSWWVFPAYRRRGIASRAVRLLVEYAFTSLELRQLEAFIAPDNVASRGVARNAGFCELGLVQLGEQAMLHCVLRRRPPPASRAPAGRDAWRTRPGST